MISVLIVLVVVGVLLWLLNTLVPIDARIKTVINVLVGLYVFFYILSALGVFHGGAMFPAMNS